jgi:hypothetical protein
MASAAAHVGRATGAGFMVVLGNEPVASSPHRICLLRNEKLGQAGSIAEHPHPARQRLRGGQHRLGGADLVEGVKILLGVSGALGLHRLKTCATFF